MLTAAPEHVLINSSTLSLRFYTVLHKKTMPTLRTETSVETSIAVRLIALVQPLLHGNASRPMTLTMRLTDLGISSIQMVQLMLSVEAEFDLTIPAGDITPENFNSIDSIAALILRLRSK